MTANTVGDGTRADPMVREWFRAAAKANAGFGAVSDLIRDYTQAQVFYRTGVQLTESEMRRASDALASQIFEIYVADGTLPTLAEIGDLDAQEILDAINGNLLSTGHSVDLALDQTFLLSWSR